MAITLRLSLEMIEWLSDGLVEGETVHQRAKAVLTRSYEARNTLRKEGANSGDLASSVAANPYTNTENRSVHQVEHTTDVLAGIPGVYRGVQNLPRGAGQVVPLPPEPEIIQAVRYVRGQHYAAGTRVAVYNRETRQTEVRIAPEVDAEGNQAW